MADNAPQPTVSGGAAAAVAVNGASSSSDPSPINNGNGPTRYIYNQIDMEAFKSSSAKRDLLGFATALGRSCAASLSSSSSSSSSSPPSYRYDPNNPLVGLSPATACMHGSLRQMANVWLKELPPDANVRARFGNPTFRAWHARLVKRSEAVVLTMLDCHRRHVHDAAKRFEGGDYSGDGQDNADTAFSMDVLQVCSEAGYAASASDTPPTRQSATPANEQERESIVAQELRAYLHQAFGHPTRLDYGTGHESSFLIAIFCLCKLRCIGNGIAPPEARHLAPVALAIFSQYLNVTRGLQKDYMLEPAGSHGVWGLDDYHCLPFYFGACQLQAKEDEDKASSGGSGGGGGGRGGEDGTDAITPRSINDNALLKRRGDQYMYLGCIRYIKELKSSVPFFESSPMLDDISQLPSWGRVARGLLRLYEGEVLNKLPVVQHFLFGTLFQATWTPSAHPREAPERTFINGPGGEECIAPWAQDSSSSVGSAPESEVGAGLPPPTRAPWAK